jgi:hypothetical protein
MTATLIRIAALSAVWSAGLAIYLVALRFVAWDLVPASSLPHVHWWRRHARPFLCAGLIITAGALIALLFLPTGEHLPPAR